MATEIRQILFNDGELVRAVSDFRKKRGGALPAGQIRSIALRDRPQIGVDLTISPDRDAPGVSVSLEGDELGAALVMYCINANIPLPATGVTKTLAMIDGRIALVITTFAGEAH